MYLLFLSSALFLSPNLSILLLFTYSLSPFPLLYCRHSIISLFIGASLSLSLPLPFAVSSVSWRADLQPQSRCAIFCDDECVSWTVPTAAAALMLILRVNDSVVSLVFLYLLLHQVKLIFEVAVVWRTLLWVCLSVLWKYQWHFFHCVSGDHLSDLFGYSVHLFCFGQPFAWRSWP